MAADVQPIPQTRGDYYAALMQTEYKYAANVTFSGTNKTSAIWTPTTGKKFRLKGFWIRCTVVTGALVGSTAGARITFYDGASLMPFVLGIVKTATDAVGTDYGIAQLARIEGIVSAAANNTLTVGCEATLGTGTIQVSGYVWGSEE